MDRTWSMVFGAVLVLVGVGALLGQYGVMDVDLGDLWPLFVVGAGVAMLLSRQGWCDDEDASTEAP